MIIFLYGPDAYRRQEKLKEIVGDYKKKHSSFSIENFDLEEVDGLRRLSDFSRANSLFDAFKFGIVRSGDSLGKAEQKEFAGFLKEQADKKESALVLIFDKKPVKELSFLLKKPVISQEFGDLTTDQFGLFIQKEAQRLDLKLDASCISLLMQAFQGDSWGLVTELEKLSLLDVKKINADTVAEHISIFSEMNLFSALNSIRSSGDIAERLRIFDELLDRNEDPAMLFNMIAVAPYEGKRWKEMVADYDAAVKSGKMEYEEALLDIALK